MKKHTLFKGILITLVLFIFSASALQAETAKKFNLSVGGYLGMGGATDYGYSDNKGAFAFGIQPEVQFFPIDNLSVTFRCLWERLFYKYRYFYNGKWRHYDYPVDVFPFLFGVRFYFPVFNKVKIFTGGGIGATIMQEYPDIPGWDRHPAPHTHFAMDFGGGVEYEIINHLTITGMFNTLLPNIDRDESIIARFMFFFGVQYYIPL
ncbi:MAG TPA: outer membrane beta-barrel protein [Spirochaetota bacterium]|nr:outer membrane beta-barrel protein [Spirochaetota bacterium]HPI87959.1 outer membrane beta-barrel protein [Spirochaetota bacterium]HPR46670.1 outer membrane beta-barrel protein [Spirochaetota bacterium]